VLALMLLGGVAEGIGLLAIVPLASIAIGQSRVPLRLFAPLYALAPDQRFLAAMALFLIAMAARSLLLFARDVQAAVLETGYGASMRLRAAATLAQRGWPFASRLGEAGVQSLLLNDVPRAVQGIVNLQQILVSAAMLVVQLGLVALLSPKLALGAVAVLTGGALLSRGRMRRAVISGEAMVERIEETTGSGMRLHAGLKAALAQGTVAPFVAEYETSLAVAQRQLVGWTRDYVGTRQIAAFGAALAAALLLFAGVRLLALPFPVLVAALVLMARMAGPAQAVQQSAQQLAADAPAFAAIERRLGGLEWPERAAPPAEPLDWSELRLTGAGYEYQPGLGLASADLALKRGQWVGVRGESGAGKTTLADLIAGLIAPQRGTIAIDGQPLAGEVARRWAAALAYAGQEPLVFNDSIRGNLLAEGADADEGALWSALETVGLAARVRALGGGLNEPVGDRGGELSGGERQRLVLARALLRRPSLLILDEATAALDPASEGAVLDAIRKLPWRPAALLIAHRESTLAHCDSIVEIRHGVLENPANRAI
jgi:ATP-binding cassette subfamily C protein